MQAVGYTRLSRANEAGASLEAQEQVIREACAREGLELVEVIQDKARSGGSLKRPGVQRALDRMEGGRGEGEAPPEVLVVARLDRLSRSVRDFANLLHIANLQGWHVMALDMELDTRTPQGWFFASVLMLVAEFERHLIGERTKGALAYKRAAGVQLGRRRGASPEAYARIHELKIEQKLGVRAITRIMNEEGWKAAQGGPWSTSSVRRVLTWDSPLP